MGIVRNRLTEYSETLLPQAAMFLRSNQYIPEITRETTVSYILWYDEFNDFMNHNETSNKR